MLIGKNDAGDVIGQAYLIDSRDEDNGKWRVVSADHLTVATAESEAAAEAQLREMGANVIEVDNGH